MNRSEFVESRRAAWEELDELLERAGSRPAKKLDADGVRRLGVLYRSASGDLGVARRRYAGDPIVGRLEHRVTRARGLVYGARSSGRAVVRFFRRDLWRSILERPACLVASFVMLFGPVALSGVWAWKEPQQAGQYLPSQYRQLGEADHFEQRNEDGGAGPSSARSAAFSSQIMTNNIRVTFIAFGGGLLLGLGTVFVLLQNGLLIGVISGLAIGAGNSRPFFELILPHGVLELSCIVVAGAAGCRVGWAIIAPGHRSRVDALRAEAVGATYAVIGVSFWLVIAGLVEGFVTPQRIGFGNAITVGASLGVVFWALVFALGRRDPREDAQAMPGDLERGHTLAESFSLK